MDVIGWESSCYRGRVHYGVHDSNDRSRIIHGIYVVEGLVLNEVIRSHPKDYRLPSQGIRFKLAMTPIATS
jgi:hypothetical protein